MAGAVSVLTSIGALDVHEHVTDLGRALSRISVDPPLARMLLMAVALGVLGPVLTVAAAMSHKDPFVAALRPQEKVRVIAAGFVFDLHYGMLTVC